MITVGSLKDVISGKYTGPQVGSRVMIIQLIANGLAQFYANKCIFWLLRPFNILISLVDRSLPVMKLANFSFVRVRKTERQTRLWEKVLHSDTSRS